MKLMKIGALLITFVCLASVVLAQSERANPIQVSGVYPHLAMYNNHGECGTGAIVPWAGSLWVITYAPHQVFGSSDKLYEITKELTQIVRPESIGGTPANRMIHNESQQLFIGPYIVNEHKNVRVLHWDVAQGRLTGNARHLTEPGDKIYYATMEEGFYEVDVNDLSTHVIFRDGHTQKGQKLSENKMRAPSFSALPGAHGKGLYSGQGVLVYSNNGESDQKALSQFDIESGVLAEWDGTSWTVIRRNQFVEVTGPGGIYGNEDPENDAIWATGWDHRSVILGVRSAHSAWHFYRLPKASHSYDGAHGWNTEWPRIRDVGTPENPDYLMTMHGLFWKFPGSFSAANSAGIRPRSAYLKVIGDFTRWNNRLVFGCDDSAQKEFLNKRKQKGGIEGPGQSNSNLWFTSLDKPDQLGPSTASGAVWLNDHVEAGQISEPMLFAGWPNRMAWVKNDGDQAATFVFEVDPDGRNNWQILRKVSLDAGATANIEFNETERGEWIRVVAEQACIATVNFNYSLQDDRSTEADDLFDGLAQVNRKNLVGGLLYGLGDDRRKLGVSAPLYVNGKEKQTGYYELDEQLRLIPREDEPTHSFIREKFAIPRNVVEIQESSVLVIDDWNRRWRLPLGDVAFKDLTDQAQLRICREVATERDLFNCAGTFYELPAENADGFAKIRPVSSHNLRIHDYASYRGLLVMTGVQADAKVSEHIVKSEDGQAAVWLGVIDDLWKLGKPVGEGGPWKETPVQANEPSDPYLIGFYDKRTLALSHNSKTEVSFTIEVEPIGHGPWMTWKTVRVKPGETVTLEFSDSFEARWIRFKTNKGCQATAWLIYE
jgi:hypothetical protein